MEYDIKSKPTVYKNVKFRSRLEARWAAFFDLIGWRWQYESHDFNGWTPDFTVYGSDDRFILIEIKPFIDDAVLSECKAKAIKSKFKGYSILLSNDFKEYCGGLFAGYCLTDPNPDFNEPYEMHWKNEQGGINSEYDIGSLVIYYDGVLWSNQGNRKIFIYDYKDDAVPIRTLWLKAQLLTSFSYA
jgi:hypothetical protein